MAVGTGSFTCYQGEDVSWQFTLSDANYTDWTGHDIELVIKATAAAADPALIGPETMTVDTATTGTCAFNVDLDPGEYVGSLRRVDTGNSWQLWQGAVTVLDSASID